MVLSWSAIETFLFYFVSGSIFYVGNSDKLNSAHIIQGFKGIGEYEA